MKKYMFMTIILVLFSQLFISCVSFGAETNEEDVFYFKEKTKNQLFVATQEFLATSIRDSKSSIEYYDKEEGVIFGQLIIREACNNYGTQCSVNLDYHYRIYITDNLIKVSISGKPYDASGMTWNENDKYSPKEYLLDMKKYLNDRLK